MDVFPANGRAGGPIPHWAQPTPQEDRPMTPTASQAANARTRSLVLEVAPAPPQVAQRHFAARLTVETDPSDLHHDLEAGTANLVIADMRSPEAFAREHIAGAINLPYRQLNPESTAHLSRDALYIAYCSHPGCNASTKGAARLAELGFPVKELIGGLEYWKREGFATTSGE